MESILNYIKAIVDFFTNANHSLRKRFGYFIFIFFVVISIDYSFNISKDILIESKLEQLEKIQKIKKSYKENSYSLKKINEIESEIISREHYLDAWYKKGLIASNIMFETPLKGENRTNEIIENKENSNSKRNLFFMILSSNFATVLAIPIMIIIPFFEKRLSFKKFFNYYSIAATAMLFVIVSTYVSYQIPIINDERIWFNYILNVIIHSVYLAGMIYFAIKNPSALEEIDKDLEF